MRWLLVVLALFLLACGDDGAGPGDPGNSRDNPARPGEAVTVDAEGFVSGEATIRLTYLRQIRGRAALDTVMEANQFNDSPPAGHDYLLARFRVEVVEAGAEAFEMSVVDWEAFSVDGTLYPEASFAACCLEASIDGEGFTGASWEGWLPLFVAIGDGAATAVYQRDVEGGTWFALE